ncbi:MAG: helix-turn-helix domain-containing protein [Candidatus Cloacimonadaceae bacterium]
MIYFHLSDALSTVELKERMKSSQDISEYIRWHALYLISAFKQSAQQVADNLAISQKTVYKWVHDYNLYGEQSIL